jgi:hypothetical protein
MNPMFYIVSVTLALSTALMGITLVLRAPDPKPPISVPVVAQEELEVTQDWKDTLLRQAFLDQDLPKQVVTEQIQPSIIPPFIVAPVPSKKTKKCRRRRCR